MTAAVRTIFRNWFGTPLPPVQLRSPGKRWGQAASRSRRRTLRVAEVVRETPSTLTYVFETPDGDPFDYHPGQHLTVLVEIDGVAHRRCYSFSTCPGIGKPAITVKHIPDGRVSGFLAEHLVAGQSLRVAEPSGTFTVEPRIDRERPYVMIAGGVGITPIASMMEAILRGEPRSHVTLLYGNRTEDEIIFRRRLANLAAEFPRKLTIRYALDEAPQGWTGIAGSLTGPRVLETLGGIDPDAEYLVCGPDPMMESVTDALAKAGARRDQVRLERFAYAEAGSTARPTGSFTVRFAKSQTAITTKPGEPILQTALESGVPLTYSCQMGGCGECKVKTSSGSVVMEQPNCLTPREIEEGYALACCAYATSDVTIEDR